MDVEVDARMDREASALVLPIGNGQRHDETDIDKDVGVNCEFVVLVLVMYDNHMEREKSERNLQKS